MTHLPCRHRNEMFLLRHYSIIELISCWWLHLLDRLGPTCDGSGVVARKSTIHSIAFWVMVTSEQLTDSHWFMEDLNTVWWSPASLLFALISTAAFSWSNQPIRSVCIVEANRNCVELIDAMELGLLSFSFLFFFLISLLVVDIDWFAVPNDRFHRGNQMGRARNEVNWWRRPRTWSQSNNETDDGKHFCCNLISWPWKLDEFGLWENVGFVDCFKDYYGKEWRILINLIKEDLMGSAIILNYSVVAVKAVEAVNRFRSDNWLVVLDFLWRCGSLAGWRASNTTGDLKADEWRN